MLDGLPRGTHKALLEPFNDGGAISGYRGNLWLGRTGNGQHEGDKERGHCFKKITRFVGLGGAVSVSVATEDTAFEPGAVSLTVTWN